MFRTLTLLTGLTFGCSALAAADTPDISTFMQIGASSLAGVNWQDGTMYFTSSMSGKNQVYRYMGEDEWPWQLSVFDEGINDFTLSHNGQWGVIRASIGGSEQGQLFLMNTL
ncbi:MAG TPA: hypothetical protein VLB27_08110, partial [candidate division Zixibacteria bacterium]|nr:hypothetical protein [candidate division Zixibacteria bacterium]